MHRLHLVGPLVAVVALILSVAGAWLRTRAKAIAKTGTGLGVAILVVLVVLYAWSAIWVLNVSRLVA